MKLDRFFLGCALLLTLVLRTTADTGQSCWLFTLGPLGGGPTWEVVACDREADAIRNANGLEFIIMDEVLNRDGALVQSTTGALLLDRPAAEAQCWEFTLEPLGGGTRWKAIGCEKDATEIRARNGLDYIICDEIAL